MTMTELPGQVDLSEHGIEPTGRVYRNPTTSLLYTHALARGRWTAGRRRSAGRRHRPLHRPLAEGQVPRRRDGSRRPDLVGRGQPAAQRGALRRPAREGDGAARAGRALYVVDAWAGADPAHRIGVRVVTAHPYHALFAKTMFIDLAPDEEQRRSSRTALVLHTPDLEADPDEDGTRTGTFVVLASGAHRAAGRRHVLRGRDQEVDLHRDERPAAARGRVPDALLGERRRGRRGGGLLRALGHRQDDALRRPGARADRRRRARLGRLPASSTSRAAATRR